MTHLTTSTQRLFKKAMEAYERKNYGAARKSFEKLLASEANHLDARYLLGTLYAQQGQRTKAFHHLNLAAKLDPSSPMIQTNLGILQQQEGNLVLAEKYFRSAISLDSDLYQAHYNLAIILARQHRVTEAVESLMATVRIAPLFFDAQFRLGKLQQSIGNLPAAEKAVKKALEILPGNLEALHVLANVLAAGGQFEAVKEAYRHIIKIDPKDASAGYALSILGGEKPQAPPRAHVQNLFNQMVETFDLHLNRLGYSAPERLFAMLQEAENDEKKFHKMLDIGCGTGAVGRVFRDRVDYLVGIDIAEKMIERSKQAAVYDELRVAELGELSETDSGYDLVVAADVFPYFGNLDPVMNQLNKRMSEGGYLLFTTERHADADDYHIDNTTGRYQYSDAYLRHIAEKDGFEVVQMNAEQLRQEKGAWLMGHFCLWKKRPD